MHSLFTLGGLNLQPNFQKGRLERILIFRGVWWEWWGDLFWRGAGEILPLIKSLFYWLCCYASIVWGKKISRTSNLVELHNFYIIIISGCPGHPGFFSNCYLAVPWPNLGHYRSSLTHLMLITWVLHMWSKGHQEPLNEVGSLSLAKHLVGFDLGTFWSSKCLKPLGHSPPALNK